MANNGVFKGLMYILILNMTAQLTRELGMAPGGEFRRALVEVIIYLHNYIACIVRLFPYHGILELLPYNLITLFIYFRQKRFQTVSYS